MFDDREEEEAPSSLAPAAAVAAVAAVSSSKRHPELVLDATRPCLPANLPLVTHTIAPIGGGGGGGGGGDDKEDDAADEDDEDEPCPLFFFRGDEGWPPYSRTLSGTFMSGRCVA